jgi:uncharacterized surface protein with fasciclin (FAS1) repeats
MMKNIVRISAQLLLVGLLAACGDETVPTEVALESATLQKGAPAPPPTVIDVADDAASDDVAPQFTILMQALEAADLVDALASKGQVTVFAPTDEAFGRLLDFLEMTPEELLADEELLEEVLKYHVAPGRRMSDDVLGSEQIRTYDGRFIYPFSNDDGAFIRDGSEDTSDAMLIPELLDIEATNGVIHGIDQVLLPGTGGQPGQRGQRPDKDDDDDDDDENEFEGWATLLSVEGDAPERVMRIDVEHDAETVEVSIDENETAFEDDGDLTDFDALLDALDVEDPMVKVEGEGEIQDDGSISADGIKVETEDDDDDDEGEDEDFSGYATLVSEEGDAPTRSLRIEVERDDMTVVVDVFEGETEFEDDGTLLDFDALLEALNDDGLMVRVEGEGDVQDDGSITAEEIEAWSEDVPVDEPLISTITDLVEAFALAPNEEDREFTLLYAALDAADLLELLDDPEAQYTVFAPTDAAFTTLLGVLGVEAADLLADENLADILLYHVLAGRQLSFDLTFADELPTAQGSVIRPVTTAGSLFVQDLSDRTEDAMLLAPDLVDLELDNGVVHVIDAVLLFE